MRRPGLDERPAEPQARRARDDDARQLEHAVRRDQLEERPSVAGADRQARDDAQQHAVQSSTAAVPMPARIPPANASNVTRMLFVKISDENAASSPGLSPRS